MSPVETTAPPAAWRAVGKRTGGTVTGIALSPDFARDKIAFAATMAGVYRSTDGGLSWQPVNDGLTSPFTISIAVAPTFTDDGLVFAGARAGGLYQTVNAGDEWHPVEIWGQRESVQAIAISPNFKRDHSAMLGSETAGVFRTTTDGKTWSASNFGLLELGVLALAYSPNFAQDETAFCITTDGFYRTPNGGRAWRESGDDLVGVALQCVAVSPSFAEDSLVVVGSEDEGVYLSTDGGRKFRKANKGLDDLCVNALAFTADKSLVAGTNSGLYVSRDGGTSWERVTADTGAVLAVTCGPDGIAFAGSAQRGIFRSEDGGRSWQEANEGLSARLFVQLAISPNFADDRTLFSVSLDEGVSRSRDEGETWEPIGKGLEEREVTALVLSPSFADDETMFAATDRGVWTSTDGGESWKLAAKELEGFAIRTLATTPSFGADGILFAAAVDAEKAEDPSALARLLVSRDRGASWEQAREGFDGRDVVAVACSPDFANDKTVYVGTFREADPTRAAEVAIWRSEDGGTSWLPLTSHQTPGRWIAIALTPSYARDRGVFVGVQSAVLRPMAGPIAASRPGRRQLWYAERIGRPNTAVVSLVASPTYEKDHALYAGTSDGVFVSRNGGLTWTPLNEGLGNKSIVSLLLSPTFAEDGRIFAASLGGAIWTFQEERGRPKGEIIK